MKKSILSLTLVFSLLSASAQAPVKEPEFVNSYCIMTNDTTLDVLPKEYGSIEKHENKTKGFLNKLSSAANIAGGVGLVVGLSGAQAGNASKILSGVKAMQTANTISDAASLASSLAGAVGMDIVFKGKKSPYEVKKGQDIRLVIKGENNDFDPMGIYRIVRFNVSGKKRRIQWMEFEPAFLDTEDAKKNGFIQFNAQKHGDQSYLITIPASEATPGEYGIFFMSLVSSTEIPVGTFSVK